ncbi:hypothetical protein PHET_08170 [Paragonimus heterotremus]|uniref:Uncharacterized protein n=1 Tax=Paragonimus heterotremus TaxID=100268 RepID=A0A8J4SLY6_9TREM|nr:hypothetical protein PHET_08170 [Paragonimus heterotremus]
MKVKWVIDHGYVQPGGQSLEGLTQFTQSVTSVRAVSYWHGHGLLESQPNTVFLSTQSILPVFAPQTSVEQKLTGVVLDITYILEWAPQVCINPEESDNVSMRQTLKVQGRTRIIYLNTLRFNCRYVIRLRQLTSDVPKEQTALSNLRTRRQDEVPTVYGCFCTPSCSEVEVNRGLPPANCTLPDPGLPSPPLNLKVKNLSKLIYRISWRRSVMTERTTRTPTYSIGTQIRDTKYRVVWAPRIDEPVSKEMYNDQAGFSPIMDLQKSDARIVGKNQTWLDLHDLKENTFYIVRVQTLIMMENEDHERESSPATLYFITPKMDEAIGKFVKVGESYVFRSSEVVALGAAILCFEVVYK